MAKQKNKRADVHRKKLSESLKGKVPWNKGITHSDKTKEKLRNLALIQYKDGMSYEHRNKIKKGCNTQKFRLQARNRLINFIELNYRIKKEGLCPNIGKYETNILDNLENCFNYNILRQYKVDGYFLDGYCPALNLALEVDEYYHKRKNIRLRDVERQSLIENKLGCMFLRLEI